MQPPKNQDKIKEKK